MYHIARRLSYLLVVAATVIFATAHCSHAADSTSPPAAKSAEEQLLSLQSSFELLSQKLKQLETQKYISAERLRQKKGERLKQIAADVARQRQATNDFQGFVTWMSSNLAGYNKYIQAGSYAAVIGRMLPIPYAGQASIFTKFVAQFTVALNAASVAIANYLHSSQKFIAMADGINPAQPDDKTVSEAALFADQKLLKDMNDAQAKLATVAELSSGALSFLEALNHYASNTDEYMNKLKVLIRKDTDPKEKSFLTENINSLKIQADRFNGKLRSFEELSRKETTAIKALAVYDELSTELAAAK